jgi:hypothetical protein
MSFRHHSGKYGLLGHRQASDLCTFACVRLLVPPHRQASACCSTVISLQLYIHEGFTCLLYRASRLVLMLLWFAFSPSLCSLRWLQLTQQNTDGAHSRPQYYMQVQCSRTFTDWAVSAVSTYLRFIWMKHTLNYKKIWKWPWPNLMYYP